MAKLKIKNKKRGKPQQIQAYVVITKEGRQAPEQRKFQNNGGCKQKQIQLKTNKKNPGENTKPQGYKQKENRGVVHSDKMLAFIL